MNFRTFPAHPSFAVIITPNAPAIHCPGPLLSKDIILCLLIGVLLSFFPGQLPDVTVSFLQVMEQFSSYSPQTPIANQL